MSLVMQVSYCSVFMQNCVIPKVELNRYLCTISKHVFIADDKMANMNSVLKISFAVMTLLYKCTLSTPEECHLSSFKATFVIFVIIWIEKWRFYSTFFPDFLSWTFCSMVTLEYTLSLQSMEYVANWSLWQMGHCAPCLGRCQL